MILPESSIYFAKCITADGLDMNAVKIGISHGFTTRLKAIETNLPFNCEFLCSIDGDIFVEYFLHFWFRDHRLGGEYFRYTDELRSMVSFILETGKLPLPLKIHDHEYELDGIDCVAFMQSRGITFADISLNSGIVASRYEGLLQKQPCGNRRFLAALAVTAVRMGMSIIWPDDFRSRSREAAA